MRELASWVERLYATGLAPEAALEMLLAEADALAADAAAGVFPGGVATLEQAELAAIRRALAAAGNNQLQAARLLNVHRSRVGWVLRTHADGCRGTAERAGSRGTHRFRASNKK